MKHRLPAEPRGDPALTDGDANRREAEIAALLVQHPPDVLDAGGFQLCYPFLVHVR
jgi:hypothetical protein